MKQKVIQTQKAKNVNILLISLIFSINISFSQIKIEGIYNDNSNKSYVVDGGEYTQFEFYKNGVFSKTISGEFGEIGYGKGLYLIKNDSLFLNYDLTELKENSYHRTKEYYNSKDSIQVKLNIYNFSKEPLRKIQVWSFPNYKSAEQDTNGVALFKFKKEKRKDKLEIHLDGEYYAKHVIYLNYDINYEIDVFMSKTDNYGFGHSKAYKNYLEKFKIIERTESYIKLERKLGIITLKKI